jgi:amidase
VEAVADFLARKGAKVSRTARPDIDLDEAHEVYIKLLRAATSRALADAAFARNLDASRTLPKDARDYAAWMARANAMHHREWLLLDDRRHRMRLAWAAFFRDWDVMLCPAAATTAFPHNQKGERWERMVTVNGKPQPSTTQMFWAGYSGMSYLPSTVAIAGRAPDGLPVGVQIIARQYGDLTAIALAEVLESEFEGFVAPPGYD